MYVSVTGLKTNNLYASMKFWLLTIPAFRAAQKADGILLCENKSRNGYQHTLTVWKTKAHMLAYVRSPKHMKAMRAFPSIAISGRRLPGDWVGFGSRSAGCMSGVVWVEEKRYWSIVFSTACLGHAS